RDRNVTGVQTCALPISLAAVAASPPRAAATQRFGPVQLSGNLQSQNLVRHPDASTYEYIQNRNTAHVRLDYDWLQAGRFYGKYRSEERRVGKECAARWA